MNLELIRRLPAGPARPTPILFVHGAYSSAQLWEPFFLPYFAERGYAAFALSLRGHGQKRRRGKRASRFILKMRIRASFLIMIFTL